MPIEIRELIIKAEIDQKGGGEENVSMELSEEALEELKNHLLEAFLDKAEKLIESKLKER
ncbi:MAG: DUF5908 family protein [Bacteroidota bacterium]